MTCTEVRPNGKLYKARKKPVAILVNEDASWPSEIVFTLVLRTSAADYESAREAAVRKATAAGFDYVSEGLFGWWRESIRNNEPFWEYDTVRGMPGWSFLVE